MTDFESSDSTVINYLRSMDWLRRTNGMGDPSWRFSSVEALILHYGKFYTPAPLPVDVERGMKQECFKNAITGTVWSDYIYVEGYAYNLIPTLHAWLTDEENLLAYDPTWDQGKEYFGIAFDSQWASRIMVDTGVFGILGGMNWTLIEGFVNEGIPDEALAFKETA